MIDAYLHLTMPGSPRLPEDISVGVPVVYTKEKAFYVMSIMDTFKSLVSADTFVKKECNSGMGFLYGKFTLCKFCTVHLLVFYSYLIL